MNNLHDIKEKAREDNLYRPAAPRDNGPEWERVDTDQLIDRTALAVLDMVEEDISNYLREIAGVSEETPINNSTLSRLAALRAEITEKSV